MSKCVEVWQSWPNPRIETVCRSEEGKSEEVRLHRSVSKLDEVLSCIEVCQSWSIFLRQRRGEEV